MLNLIGKFLKWLLTSLAPYLIGIVVGVGFAYWLLTLYADKSGHNPMQTAMEELYAAIPSLRTTVSEMFGEKSALPRTANHSATQTPPVQPEMTSAPASAPVVSGSAPVDQTLPSTPVVVDQAPAPTQVASPPVEAAPSVAMPSASPPVVEAKKTAPVALMKEPEPIQEQLIPPVQEAQSYPKAQPDYPVMPPQQAIAPASVPPYVYNNPAPTGLPIPAKPSKDNVAVPQQPNNQPCANVVPLQMQQMCYWQQACLQYQADAKRRIEDGKKECAQSYAQQNCLAYFQMLENSLNSRQCNYPATRY